MTLRLAGPFTHDNGDCPYLPARQWAADYLLAAGDVEVPPYGDLPVLGSTFDNPTVRLTQATPLPRDRGAQEEPMDGLEVFERLLSTGFRRAGRLFYRPDCDACAECVSLRVDVDRFTPSGDQRRALRKNRDVAVEIALPSYNEEKRALYARFLHARYPDREGVTPEEYTGFMVASLGNTREMHYRVGGRLVGVGIVDLTRHAASSVYFFFDPDHSKRSLGTYSALREIDFCRQSGRQWLYMGFRITACQAMQYKARYRPHQLLDPHRGWVDAAEASGP